jgi:hypothetical protein
VSGAPIEAYHQSPVNLVPSNVEFLADWQQSPQHGGWYGLQVMDNCRIHADGFMTWHGKAAARVEVDPGDDPLVLGENSERSEVAFTQTHDGTATTNEETSGDQFYAMSYYFPTSYAGSSFSWSETQAHETIDCSAGDQTQCNSWQWVMQFHPDNGFWGGLTASASTHGGTQKYGLTLGADHALSSPDVALGKWTDLVLEVSWSSGDIGLWRRDEGQTTFTKVVTGNEPTVKTQTGVYMKQGLYRGGHVNGRVDVFWLGPTARAATFAAAELAAFGTSAGP